jgi:CheY-like chemotaxis protein
VFDIYMPDMDGFEFCRRLRRSQGDGLRLLAVSGDDSDATRGRVVACGADRFLTKPETTLRLAEACDQLLVGRARLSAASSR